MNILFLHRWVGVHEGGTETDIKNLMIFLASRGHRVGLITSCGDALDQLIKKHPNIQIWQLPLAWGESKFSYDSAHDPRLYLYTGIFVWRVFLKTAWLIVSGRFKAEVISVHFVTEALAAWMVRLILRVPYVFVLEGYTDLEARVARWANLQFSCSRYDIEQCSKKFGYRPIHRWFGVDTTRFCPRGPDFRGKYFPREDFIVLSVCRLEPRKNLETLIKAAKITSAQEPGIKYLIVGEGVQENKLRAQVKSLGLGSIIKFAGRVADEELASYYRTGDIYVLPTLYEGFGIVFIEAMASGLPIISTTAGAVPEVVGGAGILVEPRDYAALARAILHLYRHPEEREKLKERGLILVKERFNAQALMGIYEQELIKLSSTT